MAEEPTTGTSAASRQKSCHACVKGKRRCNKGQPVCSRCEEKNIQCTYAKRNYTEAFNDFDSVEFDMSWVGCTASSSSIGSVGHIPPLATSAGLDPAGLATFDEFMETSLEFAENQDVALSDMQLISSASNRPSLPHEEQALNRFDYGPMADLCMQYKPWQVYDPNTKVHFIVQSLKGFPGNFARDNCTPWLHRYLYRDQMPSSIQSCFTVSVLYSNMTNSNKTSVFRVLCENLNELERQQEANTPQDKLARTQALFLYQIIGLFDGDVTLRSNADRNMTWFQDWLDELCEIRENLRTPGNMTDPNPPRSWECWIFSESVRRTIVIAYAFVGLWSVMSHNNDDVFFRAWKYLHSWTMSRPSWEAPSSISFFQTWKAYHVIENFDLESFLKSERADDADDFSKVFMVAYLGVDETKRWLIDRGSAF